MIQHGRYYSDNNSKIQLLAPPINWGDLFLFNLHHWVCWSGYPMKKKVSWQDN